MKKILALFFLVLFAGAVMGQATIKQHYEISTLAKPLGIKLTPGSLVWRADSAFWMVMDSTFAKTDSGTTIVRKGSTYFHFPTDSKLVKYSLGADTASTTLRSGAMRLTVKYLWIKVNGTWKKITLS